MKKILVPCDFSGPAQEAFKFAVRIATESKGEIHVLYILDITFLRGNPTLSHSYAFNLNFLKDMEQEAEAKFKEMCEKYSPLTLPVKFRHIVGTLAPDIEAYVRKNEIDLVIMGTHGEGNARWGSNTEKIVRHSPAPVFAIRKEPGREVKKIVVPVIPEHPDKNFYERLLKLQAFFNASLYLLWVNTPGTFRNDADANNAIQEFAQSANLSNYSINVRSDYSVEEGIINFAKEINADMLAMATHGWKGLVHFIRGSVTEDIVNDLQIPVFTCSMND